MTVEAEMRSKYFRPIDRRLTLETSVIKIVNIAQFYSSTPFSVHFIIFHRILFRKKNQIGTCQIVQIKYNNYPN